MPGALVSARDGTHGAGRLGMVGAELGLRKREGLLQERKRSVELSRFEIGEC